MVSQDEMFNGLVNDFSKLDQVAAILLGGSRASKTNDENSDFDLYVHSDADIDVEIRKQILQKYCDSVEMDKTWWERVDCGLLKSTGVLLEIIFRDLRWIENSLDDLLIKNKVSVGYSTILWHQLLSSNILYEREKWASNLQKKYTIPFPAQLKHNIINNNFPLMRGSLTALVHDIAKSVRRNDPVSTNHRVTVFLESYFDIIFALNELPMQSRKKILELLKREARIVPADMDLDVRKLIEYVSIQKPGIVEHINKMLDKLEVVLKDQHYF